MDHDQVRKYWEKNAPAWTELSRAGYDTYRDHLNTPAFLQSLPDVSGLSGLDLGCGEGYNTRLLAERGANVTALDVSGPFVLRAQQLEDRTPLGIDYLVASAVELPFPPERFDFATAFMSLMDIPETGLVLREMYRILKPGGFLQFSITHPCFDTPHRKHVRDEEGRETALEVGEYFQEGQGEIQEWIFSASPPDVQEAYPPFRIPTFRKTLSSWVNLLVEVGFQIEHLAEPRPSDDVIQRVPNIQDAQVVAYFLHLRVRK
jgi:ubiquinone/menaquinone biosynthesis C-methylase UbiE